MSGTGRVPARHDQTHGPLRTHTRRAPQRGMQPAEGKARESIKYRAKVRETQGDAPIVETTEEKNIVPLLRKALGLPTE